MFHHRNHTVFASFDGELWAGNGEESNVGCWIDQDKRIPAKLMNSGWFVIKHDEICGLTGADRTRCAVKRPNIS